jgi:hypothetical protein
MHMGTQEDTIYSLEKALSVRTRAVSLYNEISTHVAPVSTLLVKLPSRYQLLSSTPLALPEKMTEPLQIDAGVTKFIRLGVLAVRRLSLISLYQNSPIRE